MAITLSQYSLFRDLFLANLLPQRGGILEIGEANWYGESPIQIKDDIATLISDENRRKCLLIEYEESLKLPDIKARLFAMAGVVYQLFWQPAVRFSIDFHGTSRAIEANLNEPLKLDRQFNTVINQGTAEHIFNIAQVFETMHDRCTVGGLMIHEAPFTGWIDHGFYCLQPTLFYDVARVNDYAVRMLALDVIGQPPQILGSREELLDMAKAGEIPNNAHLFVVLQKQSASPFRVPMQGYYGTEENLAASRAWSELR